jgi:hypothetical protein
VQDLVDVGNGYVRELRVWPNTRGVVVSSGVSRLLAFGLIALAALGWVAAALRWSASRKLRKRALGPSGWAVLVVLAMLAVKACVDLVLASPWASAWYSAPQRLAAGFVVGGGAWCGVRWLSARAAPLAYAAVAALVVIAFPLNATDWKDDAHRQRGRDSWIEQIDLAADWTLRHGPEGRYGARDAGLLGHRLDGVRRVVNLDGLANDYDFADLVIDDAPLRRRVSAEGVDYFVGRVTNRERRDDLDCATVLWTSPGRPIGFDDSVEGYTVGRLYVLDVRGCRSTSGER